MVIPAWVFANLVMIHAQFRFGFFKALLYRPSKTAEPNEYGQPCASGGIAHEVSVNTIRCDGAPDNEPDGSIRDLVFGKDNASFGKLIFNGSFCSFRDFTAVPEKVIDAFGQGLYRDGFSLRAFQDSLFAHLAFVFVLLLSGNRHDQPAGCI